MDKNPTVSVIIPVFNESQYTKAVIPNVQASADLDFEFIIVNDGSTDDTDQTLSSIPGIKYLKHEQNRGVSPAWNTGIRAAKGDFVIILNNDISIADGHWMSGLVNAIKGRKAISGAEYVDFNSATAVNGRIRPYLNGWCYAFPRRIFSEIGMFDEAFAPASFEDAEFCARAAAHGYSLVEQSVRIQHAYARTTTTQIGNHNLARYNERNKIYFDDKVQSWERPRLRINIDCPSNGRKWGAFALEETGLGGSETALTFLTREWASRGHEVRVFNDAPNTGEMGEGVYYHNRADVARYAPESDVFIAFRCPSEHITATPPQARRIFWSCDQRTAGDWRREVFPHVDDIVCISDYHASHLTGPEWQADPSKIRVIGCPVRSWDYEPHPAKDLNQFLFCSVPDRGLDYMKLVMMGIRQEKPEARLTVTSDYRLWGAAGPLNERFRAAFGNEDFRGLVPRPELIQLQLAAAAQPYPCTYEECFCIAVAECAAAGAIPITTDIGAVRQTVGNSGIIVGPPSGDFAQAIARATLEVHDKPERHLQAIENSWRWSVVNIANQWEQLFYAGEQYAGTVAAATPERN